MPTRLNGQHSLQKKANEYKKDLKELINKNNFEDFMEEKMSEARKEWESAQKSLGRKIKKHPMGAVAAAFCAGAIASFLIRKW